MTIITQERWVNRCQEHLSILTLQSLINRLISTKSQNSTADLHQSTHHAVRWADQSIRSHTFQRPYSNSTSTNKIHQIKLSLACPLMSYQITASTTNCVADSSSSRGHLSTVPFLDY